MGRLIREEDVKQEIDKWLDSVGTVYVGKGLSYYSELLGCIENAPTAYDVKKVVEQLEREKVAIIDDYTEEYEDMVFLEEAIEIVRNGGVK